VVAISRARLACMVGSQTRANRGKLHPQQLQQKHGAVVAVPAPLIARHPLLFDLQSCDCQRARQRATHLPTKFHPIYLTPHTSIPRRDGEHQPSIQKAPEPLKLPEARYR
jgi:hypothetical protein